MATQRALGSPASRTRTAILDATARVLIEQGYAGVSSRSVAARAGVHPSNIHYYFPTLDDLLVAVLARGAEKNLERIAAALASPRPLMALWRLSSDRRGMALLNELMAAANHRKALKAEVSELAGAARRMQVDALRELLPEYGIDEELFPAEMLAAIIQGTALLVVREESLKTPTRPDVVDKSVEALIERLESRRELRVRSD